MSEFKRRRESPEKHIEFNEIKERRLLRAIETATDEKIWLEALLAAIDGGVKEWEITKAIKRGFSANELDSKLDLDQITRIRTRLEVRSSLGAESSDGAISVRQEQRQGQQLLGSSQAQAALDRMLAALAVPAPVILSERNEANNDPERAKLAARGRKLREILSMARTREEGAALLAKWADENDREDEIVQKQNNE